MNSKAINLISGAILGFGPAPPLVIKTLDHRGLRHGPETLFLADRLGEIIERAKRQL